MLWGVVSVCPAEVCVDKIKPVSLVARFPPAPACCPGRGTENVDNWIPLESRFCQTKVVEEERSSKWKIICRE